MMLQGVRRMPTRCKWARGGVQAGLLLLAQAPVGERSASGLPRRERRAGTRRLQRLVHCVLRKA